MSKAALVARRLAKAGITLGGDAPWDLRVHDPRFYGRVIRDAFLGLGESYMDGWWECERIDELCRRLLRAGFRSRPGGVRHALSILRSKAINLQSHARARQVVREHYDLGNELFRAMLDDSMTYTCGYWGAGATNLGEAQHAKLDLICRKLALERGMRVLDIGCGFGSFMKFAAEHYGVSCVGYSLSKEQTRLGRERCAGLPIEFIERDYRAIEGSFDRVASIGMFEAVGDRNFRPFMRVLAGALKPDGVALLHTIGNNTSNSTPEPWFDRYIFPNSCLPSISKLGSAIEGLLHMEDWHAFGTDYDLTLMAWNSRFQSSWPDLRKSDPERFADRFKRMWEFYLLSMAGTFRARYTDLWQIVLTPIGRERWPRRVS